MEKTIEIPEGYEARIEGNKVILELKESNDERIMKDIITALSIGVACGESALYPEATTTLNEAIAYLKKQKEQHPSQSKRESLAKIIKGEFEGFRNLLKKKGIDYEPQSTYWESFARLFDSSAREYLKEQKPLSTEEIELNSIAFLEQMGYTCIPPRKEEQ